MPTPSPKVRLAGTAVVTLLLGLGAGIMMTSGGSGVADAYTITVDGTLRTSVTCGTTTIHTEGPDARFLAEPGVCEVEGMLSPVMPVRGTVSLSGPGSYRCTRVEVDLHCEGPL